jgi:hypothetical protein
LHELYPELPDALATEHPALDRQLREALTRLRQGLGSQATRGDVARQVEAASQLLDQALGALIPAETAMPSRFERAGTDHLIIETTRASGESSDGR